MNGSSIIASAVRKPRKLLIALVTGFVALLTLSQLRSANVSRAPVSSAAFGKRIRVPAGPNRWISGVAPVASTLSPAPADDPQPEPVRDNALLGPAGMSWDLHQPLQGSKVSSGAASPQTEVWAAPVQRAAGGGGGGAILLPPSGESRPAVPAAVISKPVAVPAASGSGSGGFVFGSDADLASHKGDGTCWQHFDFGMVDAWDNTAAPFCVPRGMDAAALASVADAARSASSAAAGSGSAAGRPAAAPTALTAGRAMLRELTEKAAADASWLVCRVTTDRHLPAATAPHTLCDGANFVLDLARMSPINCPVNRPGYKCDNSNIHWRYEPGAWTAACTRTPSFTGAAFPRDHLMDIFGGFGEADSLSGGAGTAGTGAAGVGGAGIGGGSGIGGLVPAGLPPPLSDAAVTLIVTRERSEHANLFHASSDWINAFITLHVAGIIDGHAGTRAGMERVQVLLLDEQTGPFETTIWRRVFSPAFPVLQVSALRSAGTVRPLLRRPLFSPPGYSNFLLAAVTSESECHARTQLLQSYRAFFLRGMGLGALADPLDALPPPPPADGSTASAPAAARRLRVTFVSRRPYNEAGVDHAFMGRQLENEEELVAALQASTEGGPAEVVRLDLARMPVDEQLATMARTDVLVAMHGAALTYGAVLPPHAGVLELWPKDRDMWRCFEHLSGMAGMAYVRWENRDPGHFRADSNGDYTRVPPDELLPMYAGLLADVRKRVQAAIDGQALMG